MRVLFAGTPDFAVPSLESLAARGVVCAVLTSPDARKGRGRRLRPSPVASVAEGKGLPVLKFSHLGAQAREAVLEYEPDLLAVVAFGKIFGPRFLSLFPRGGVNVHPSLLPHFRGPSPIPAAILAGASETGVTVQSLAEEMDAGAIIRQERLPLDGTETAETLETGCASIGARLLTEAVERICNGTAEFRPQDEAEATYCPLIRKEDGLIDWRTDAITIERKVRAYAGWPTAYTTYHGRRISIVGATVSRDESGKKPGTAYRVDKNRGILVQSGSGSLVVEYLQPQSKKPMYFRDFLNGHVDFIGSILGLSE